MRHTKRPPETYTADEIKRLLAVCGRGRTGARTRALIVLLWRAGLRISEALSLRLCDIESRSCHTLRVGGGLDPELITAPPIGVWMLRVRRGKGHKMRTVALDAWSWGWISPWLAVRPHGATVLCTLKGGPLTPDRVRHTFRRLQRRAKLEKRVHAHGFRHSYALELAREGVPMAVIAAALGHSSIATTTRYVAHFGAPEVLERLSVRVEPWAGAAGPPPAGPVLPAQASESIRSRRPAPKASAGHKKGTRTSARSVRPKRRTGHVRSRRGRRSSGRAA